MAPAFSAAWAALRAWAQFSDGVIITAVIVTIRAIVIITIVVIVAMFVIRMIITI